MEPDRYLDCKRCEYQDDLTNCGNGIEDEKRSVWGRVAVTARRDRKVENQLALKGGTRYGSGSRDDTAGELMTVLKLQKKRCVPALVRRWGVFRGATRAAEGHQGEALKSWRIKHRIGRNPRNYQGRQ
jgi:hypothetical protein